MSGATWRGEGLLDATVRGARVQAGREEGGTGAAREGVPLGRQQKQSLEVHLEKGGNHTPPRTVGAAGAHVAGGPEEGFVDRQMQLSEEKSLLVVRAGQELE